MTTKEDRMNLLTKAATVLTKLMEVLYDVGAVGMCVGLVLFLVDRDLFPGTLVKGSLLPGEALEVHGFSIVCTNPDGTMNTAAFVIFFLAGGLILELMAWVFRNAHLILRTMQGDTKFSKGKTPFQPDNVRMMREIGIFFISITVVQLVFSIIAVCVIGPEMAEVSADFTEVVTGLLMLCLSQVFAVGTQMQKDVDGLV